MCKPEYLSPSAIMCYRKDPKEYYLRYLVDNRPPKFPQTLPMAVGSAFDAFAKSYLHRELLGLRDPKFEFGTIFEAQVEEQNRDQARIAGNYLFEEYKRLGALSDLMLELSNALTEPRFEFTIQDRISDRTVCDCAGIPLLGKPDLYFVTKAGTHMIDDWKVNGYCGKGNTSPKPGYVKIRPGGGQHKDCVAMAINEINVNVATTLENVCDEWALQLAIYGWLLGEPIGGDFVIGIEQLVCKSTAELPIIRCASHRLRIGRDYQIALFSEIAALWNKIETGTIVDSQTAQDLDGYYQVFEKQEGVREDWTEWITSFLRTERH